MSVIDAGEVRAELRRQCWNAAVDCGNAIVRDLKDEVSDPVASRPTRQGWPLRKDTGEGQRSIEKFIIETADGVILNVGRAMKWYMAFWELEGRFNKSAGQYRIYPWFWPTIRRNIGKYLTILGAKGTSGIELDQMQGAGASMVGGEGQRRTARMRWRGERKVKRRRA